MGITKKALGSAGVRMGRTNLKPLSLRIETSQGWQRKGQGHAVSHLAMMLVLCHKSDDGGERFEDAEETQGRGRVKEANWSYAATCQKHQVWMATPEARRDREGFFSRHQSVNMGLLTP